MENILIIEDSPFTSSLIEDYLNNNNLLPCGIATTFIEAKELFIKHLPSIVLCDIHLEGSKSGIEFVEDIRNSYPCTIIIFISADIDHRVLSKAQQTKPSAYLTKPFTEEQLITTIDLAIIERKNNHPSQFDLTDKDIEVIQLISEGKSNKQIGETLFISPHTVDSRRRKILLKLNVSTINQAICMATEKGWLLAKSTIK
jgi:DNA-binding NarL/FixJ family response regulator